MSVQAEEPLVADEGAPEAGAAEYCGRGVCAAPAGHEGTCDEASGWAEDVVATYDPYGATWVDGQARTWRIWTSQSTSTAAWVNDDPVWNNWTQTGFNLTTTVTTTNTLYDRVWRDWQTLGFDMDAQRRAEREVAARHDRMQREREERSRRRLAAQPLLEKADERALELLELILTPEEKVYRSEHDGQIMVTGGDTGDLYIVDTSYYGVHGNIRQVDEHGCVLATLCVAPRMEHTDEHGDRYGMPLADGFVGQILSIKHNERELLAKANFSGRRQCSQPDVPIIGRSAA